MDSSDTDDPLVNVYTYIFITLLNILKLYRQIDEFILECGVEYRLLG